MWPRSQRRAKLTSMRVAPSAMMAGLLLLGAAAPSPPPSPSGVPTPSQIVAGAPDSDWRTVDPDRLLVMELADGRRLAIELAADFAPVHVANIRALARAGWWDGAAIVRVQDDYVVQWAGTAGRALPKGVLAHPPAEYDRPAGGLVLHRLGSPDSYAPMVGFAQDWPVAGDGRRLWLAHCYGMVGVGRDLPPDTGDGTELYAVIGQAPRQLDRNIALVGRVLDGMPLLAALPRGSAALGFYAEPGQRVPIRRIRLAADMPEPERPRAQVLLTGSASFQRYLAASTNRRDPFFVHPAGGLDLCNARVPSRLR